MKSKRLGPIKVNMGFDAAIQAALGVKPPAGGWGAYDEKLKQKPPKKHGKKVARMSNLKPVHYSLCKVHNSK